MEKALRTTSTDNGHSHTYNDSESDFTSLVNEHRHEYIVDGTKVEILEADNHIHQAAEINKEHTIKMEKKQINVPFTIKQIDEDDDNYIFEGYASTFGNVDLGDDIVERGAFSKTLKDRMPKLLWQHQMNEPIGVFTEAFEDDKGLFVRGKMPKSDDFVKGRVMPQMKIGSVDSMSIGFSIVVDEYDRDTGIRKIKEVFLYEASLVTIPMNPKAVITGIKALEERIDDLNTLKDINNYLKDCGLSKTQTEGVMAKMREVIKESKSQSDQSKSEEEIKTLILANIDKLKTN